MIKAIRGIILLRFNTGALIFLSLMWLPAPFIGFFSHHDGLMVTTVMQVKQALMEQNQWPFNQYGPSWALFFGYILNDVPGNHLLVSMRIIILTGYAITGIFTYKTARLFGGKNLSVLSLILLTANQPFVFDLLPWPSAFVMPLVSMFAYLIISTIDSEKKGVEKLNRKLLLSGALIPLIVLSRIQVGCILLAVGIWAVIAFQERRQLMSFLSGFAFSSAITIGFLAQNGWLIDAVKDQVVFGSSYLHSENNPFPKFTIGLVLIILTSMFLARKFPIKALRIEFRRCNSTVCVPIALFLLIVLVLSMRHDVLQLLTLTTRKIWVSVPLACMAYLTLKTLSRARYNSERKGLAVKNNRNTVLLLISIGSYSQIFPLFDQMHSWWGYAPSAILIALVFREITEKYDRNNLRIYQYTAVTVLTILAVVTQTVQFQNNIPLKATEQFSLTFTSMEQASEMSKLQDFFSNSMPKGSKVLNLCENTDVFFNDQFISSASRVFVFWPAMEKSEYLIKEIKKSKQDYAVLCRNLEIPRLKYMETGAPRVLDKLNGKFIRVNQLRSNSGYEWIIYKHASSR
jgi:hypothetical protein